jgi:hypothetical protein
MARTIAALAWPVALGSLLLLGFGGDGFNPTDEGLVASASHRLLQGQIPHLDFVWPRPVGSAYLHILGLLSPTPLIMTGRLVGLATLIAYSLVLAWLILGRSPRRWGLAASAGVGASVMVNLHTFPLMPWYTIDGLLLMAAGFLVLRSGMERSHAIWVAIAFLLLGLATTTKQSFWPAPALGLVWLLARGGPGVARHALLGTIAAAVPVGLYAAGVVVAGGGGLMIQQLMSGQLVVGQELLRPFESPMTAPLAVGLPAMLALVRHASAHLVLGGRGIRSILVAAARIGPAFVLTGLVAWIVVHQRMALEGNWAILLFWVALVYMTTSLFLTRRTDSTGILLLAVAWMTTLSWGVIAPSLVAGSLALYVVHRVSDYRAAAPSTRTRPGWSAAAATALLLVVVPTFVTARVEHVYRDAPRAALTQDLGRIHHNLAGIRTNHQTAAYIRGIADCVADHPARWVAVLPDNPALYPVFGWENPLPIDFLYPPDYQGSEGRITAAAQRLDRSGDYLVLFQTVRVDALARDAAEVAGTFAYDPGLQDEVAAALTTGRPVDCGVAVGLWAPEDSNH